MTDTERHVLLPQLPSGQQELTAGAESVVLFVGEGIGTIEFSSPKANALSGAQLGAIAAALHRCDEHSAVRVVVLQSAGAGAFCGGASFEEFQKIDSSERGTEFFSGFAKVILAIRAIKKLVIVRVQGKAVGGGVGLIAAADYAIASTELSIRLSEYEIGIGPFVIAAAVERKIGPSAFQSFALDCRWRNSAWALSHQLIYELHPDQAGLDQGVKALALHFAGRSVAATVEMKKLLWAGTESWPTLLPERAAITGRLLAEMRGYR